MVEFARSQYLEKLVSKMHDGRVKVITGIRRCGKSYLLFDLFVRYLRDAGVPDSNIIQLALDDLSNIRYRNPFELDSYLRKRIKEVHGACYVLIDEIQFVAEMANPYVDGDAAKITFVDVLLGLMKIPGADIYVTGSNSKMLSSDILTQFRDRGDEIRVFPLSYAEFREAYEGNPDDAWAEYWTYGGMPEAVSLPDHEDKSRYLRDLFRGTYLKDVVERHRVDNDMEVLDDLLDILASSVGSLTNPNRLSNTFMSDRKLRINSATVARYLDYFEDAFLVYKAKRYNVKGNRYIQTPVKYYFSDVGLRNAKLGFRQQEETHIMENVLFCDLVRRGCDVDVGVIEQNAVDGQGRHVRKQLEVDFVVNRGSNRIYLQSALSIADPDKRRQEIASLVHIPDSFAKAVLVRDRIEPWRDDKGILYMGIEQFLLDDGMLGCI